MVSMPWRQLPYRHPLIRRQIVDADSALANAKHEINGLFPRRKPCPPEVIVAAAEARRRAAATDDPVWWLITLILLSPQAAAAQQQMDKHPHGYADRRARLLELIDFNDVFVSAVLNLPAAELTNFNDNLKQVLDKFCKFMGSRCFSNRQFEAITHGLSREIAVYRAALHGGFEVRMTSRTEDAMGIDMVISDPHSKRAINIDCKTHSSYYYRLEELVREGRLSHDDFETAQATGYVAVTNGHGDALVHVILWRIDQDTYGPIIDFSFVDVSRLLEVLQTIINLHGTSV